MADYTPQFIKANEKGRPPEREDNSLKIPNFIDGTSVYYNLMTEDGFCRRCINARCEGNTLVRRHGKVAVGAVGDAGEVYMEAVMQVTGGEDVQYRLVEGSGAGVQLQALVSGTWTDVGSNIGTADDRADWFWASINISGEDRLYFTNGVSDIQYTNGTTISTVTGVKARYITNHQGTLVIAYPTATFAPNYILYAKSGSHQFYSDDDSGYASSSQYFQISGKTTGIRDFNSMVYVMTESDGMYEIDLDDLTIRQVSTHGCIAPKSLTSSWDMMAWCNQDGVWGMAAGSSPQLLSKKVEAIYGQTAAANIKQIVAGFNTNGQLEVHLGTLTFEGTEYTDYTLVYEVEQSRYEGQNIWREDYGKIFPNNMVNWTNSYGFAQTYYGSRYTQTTYLNDYGYEDDTTDITMIWQSKDFKIADEDVESLLANLYIKYEPSGSEILPLDVYVRVDGGAWNLLQHTALPASSNAIAIAHIPVGQANKACRTLAFKLVSTDDASLRIYEIHAQYNYTASDIAMSDAIA